MSIRIRHDIIEQEVTRVLAARGVNDAQTAICARVIAENSLDGVTSHGVTRFPHFVGTIDQGLIVPNVEPELVASFGAIERWDGKRGLGPVMATRFMARATELAAENGIGCVAARNTTHWLRGGTYGLQAARQGFAAICWTNARPGMPAWGGTNLRLGNNPIVFALPGEPPMLVDIALSQFSYGKIQEAALAGRKLPVPGGIGFDGQPTDDAGEIIATLKAGAYRLLPMGYWKGSALAFMLDAMAALLAGGLASREVETETTADVGISQVFVSIDLKRMMSPKDLQARLDELVAHLKTGHDGVAEDVRFPGEGAARQRAHNLKHGAPVDETVWAAVTAL
jgi:3-dehydro-L-gulonate 2-dehydrogenase